MAFTQNSKEFASRGDIEIHAPSVVPILLCIDAEPDAHDPPRNDKSFWYGVEKCFSALESWRNRLSETTAGSPNFNWFVRADPQIAEGYGDSAWGLSHYETAWRSLMARGDEVGLHVHAQRWVDAVGGWCAEHRDHGWISHCVHMGFAAYERVLLKRCAMFRFGNRFMNTSLARMLTEVGTRYDLTLEPGYRGRSDVENLHSGYCPNYARVPREPYRADVNDVFCPDPCRVAGAWHIPLTTGILEPAGPCSQLPYHRPVAPESNAYRTFNLGLAPNRFRRGVDNILQELEHPYLAVVFRANAILNPNVDANLETLRTHPLARKFWFTTPGRALQLLGYERSDRDSEARHNAQARPR